MGVFLLKNYPPPSQVASMNMISLRIHDALTKWKSIVDSTPFSLFEETYQDIQSTRNPTTNDHILVESDPYNLPYWLDSPPYLDYLLYPLPSNESIMGVMFVDEMPWKDHHH